MATGTGMVWSLGLKSSVYPIHMPGALGGATLGMYAAVPALILNLLIAVTLTILFRTFASHRRGAARSTQAVLK
jgi:SSS family solute:Na+ symporter